jgi:hypothetical protein
MLSTCKVKDVDRNKAFFPFDCHWVRVRFQCELMPGCETLIILRYFIYIFAEDKWSRNSVVNAAVSATICAHVCIYKTKNHICSLHWPSDTYTLPPLPGCGLCGSGEKLINPKK